MDIETIPGYQLTIKTNDVDVATALDSVSYYYIYLCDVNDNAPIFVETSYSTMLEENLNIGQVVYLIPKIDVDYGSYCGSDSELTNGNYLLNISIVSGDTTLFGTDNSLQGITLLTKLDFEVLGTQTYTLTIEVDDFNPPNQPTRTDIVITLVDSNDNAPVFDQVSYYKEMPEGMYTGSETIIVVSAEDDDSNLNGDVKYRIISITPDTANFTIDSDTGIISTDGPMNLDADPNNVTYYLVVEAFDLGSPEQTTEVDVIILIINTNDNPPIFVDENIVTITSDTVSVSEEIPKNYRVYKAVARDADGDPLFYSITSDPSSSFIISEISGVVYSSADSYCMDSDSSVTIIIEARDRLTPGAGQSSPLTLTITINDVNDHAPEFCPTEFAITASSPLPADSNIGELTPFDLDKCNSGFNYTIIGGADETLFRFNGNNLETVSSISFTAGEEFEIEINVTDTGSTVVKVSTATIKIVLIQFVPIELEISNGYFTSEPIYDRYTVAENSDLFTEISPNLDGSIVATLGDLTDTFKFKHSPLNVSNFKVDLLTEYVYGDEGYSKLYFSIQHRSSFYSTDVIGNTRVIFSVNNSGPIVSDEGYITAANGIAIFSLEIPSNWFDPDSELFLSLDVEFPDLPISNIEKSFRLNDYPDLPTIPLTVGNIILRIPQRELYPGDNFVIYVYGEAVGEELTSIDFSITTTSDEITFLSVDSVQGWSASFISFGNTAIIAAFRANQGLPITDKKYLTINAKVKDTLSSDVDFPDISYVVNQLSSVIESAVPLESTHHVLSYFGDGETGCVGLYRESLRAVYAVASTPQIINTAVLTNTPVQLSYSAYAIVLSTIPYLRDDVIIESCSGDSSIFTIDSSGCNARLTASSQPTSFLEDLRLTISVNDVNVINSDSTSASYNIWTPSLDDLVLSVSDPELSVISNYERLQSGFCISVYQNADIYAFTTINNPSGSSITARVEHLIADQITFSPPDRLSRVGTSITGLNAGVTMLSYQSKSVQVTTTTTPVTVDRINVIVATGITFNPNTDPSYPVEGPQTVEAGYVQNLDRPGLDAALIAFAKFSDGYHRIVGPSDGMEFSSSDASIATVSGSTLSITGEGVGCYITAQWSSLETCTSDVGLGVGFIDVEFDEPDVIDVTITQDELVHASDQANSILPTETSITVILRYGDVSIDMTSDPRTEYSFENSRITLGVNDCGLNCRMLSVQDPTDSGVATIRVRFTHITAFKEISLDVYRSNRLEFIFAHEPTFFNALTIPVLPLNPIENSPLFQKASVSVNLILIFDISFKSYPISTNPALQLTSNKTDTLLVENRILLPQKSGSAVLIGSFGSLTTAREILISSTPAYVIDINARFQQNGNTLSGQLGNEADTFDIDILLDDETWVNDIFSFGTNSLPGILNFTDTQYFSLDEDTGILTILSNSPRPITYSINSFGYVEMFTFYSNLEASNGDLDFGKQTGLPIELPGSTASFNAPLSINSGKLPDGSKRSLGGVNGEITYDSNVFEVTGITISPSWPGQVLDVNIDKNPIQFSAALQEDESAIFATLSDPVEVFYLTMNYKPGIVDSATFYTEIMTYIIEINDASQPSMIITSETAATAGTFRIGTPQGNGRRSVSSVEPARTRRQSADCGGYPPPGDANGDCRFTVADVTYTLNYIVEVASNFPSGSYYGDALQRQLDEMDPTLDNKINSNDPRYLNRILVGFLPFVREVTILSTHEYNTSDCRIKVEATIVDKSNVSITDPNSMAFYAGLFATDPVFETDIGAVLPENGFGSKVSDFDVTNNFHGQFYRTEYSDGRYRLQLLPEFETDYEEIAVILAVAIITSDGTTSTERSSAFFNNNDFPTFSQTFSKRITDNTISVDVQKTSRFDPLRTISYSLTYSQCNNLNSPTFTQANYTGGILEDANPGDFVLQVNASDPDTFTNAEIAYTLFSQSVDGKFVIDAISGIISVADALDREIKDEYSFKVTATDNGISQVLSGEVDVVINILDVNDNFPIFVSDFYGHFAFYENATLGLFVVQVNATDLDIDNNGLITYSLGPDCLDYFNISSDGTVRISNPIDYESDQAFQCTIIAKDNGVVPKNDTTYISIEFIPQNDLPPQCPASVVLSFALNAPINHVVAVLTAQDDDLGLDHNILAYQLTDLSTENSFYITQVDNNHVELRTNIASFTTGSYYSATLNITDLVWHLCVTKIEIYVEESSYFDFSFTSPKIAFFRSGSEFNFVDKSYQQEIGFFVEDKDTTDVDAVAERAGQTEYHTITKEPQTAANGFGVVRGSTTIYFDQPWVRVSAQFSSASGSTYLQAPTGARITLISQTRPLESTGSICTPGVITDGICTGTVMLSSDWFQANDTADVYITLDGIDTFIREIFIMHEREIPATTTENLFVSVPHRRLFPTDTFTITLGSYTRYEPIGFEMSISYMSHLLGFIRYTPSSGWLCGDSSTDSGGLTTLNYVCNYPDTDGLNQGRVNKYTDLVVIDFLLYSDEAFSYAEFTTLGKTLTANNANIYSVSSGTQIHKYDSNGFSPAPASGTNHPRVYYESDTELHVFGFVEDSEVLNDLKILNVATKTIDAGIAMKSVRKNPNSNLLNLFLSTFDCDSSDTSILKITGNCLLFLDGDTSVNGDLVTVTISRDGEIITTISLRVWIPVQIGSGYLEVVFSDDTLQPISTCEGLYQQTRVILRGQFVSPSETALSVFYSDYDSISIQVSRTDVTTYSNGIITVNSNFSENSQVEVKLLVLQGISPIGEGTFYVDPNYVVTLEVIKPEVFTEMTLTSVPNTITDLSTDRLFLRAKLTENCDADLKPNYVSTKAVFSDGHTQILDNLADELELKPYPPILKHTSGLTLQAYGSGSGPVEVCWKCSAAAPKCGETSVTCSIPPPDGQTLVIDPSVIAYPGSIAQLAGYPSVATITQISLTYGSDIRDLRADDRTTISINDTDSLFNFNTSTLEFTPRTNTGSGYAYITVTFSQAPNVLLQGVIQLVTHRGIEFTLSPFPSYPDSLFNSVDTLKKINGTSVYQRGFLTAVLNTDSNDPSGSILISDLATYTTDTSILQISSDRIVTPVTIGVANITVNFYGLEASISVTVTNDLVGVFALTRFQLPSDTLNGLVNQSQVFTLDILLDDLTNIIDFFSDSYYRSDQRLVRLTSVSDTRGAIQLQQNGRVSILDNYHGLLSVAAISGLITTSTSFAVNLDPAPGDFDIGEITGIPIGPLQRGSTYNGITIRLNAGVSTKSFDMEIIFDEDVFEPTGEGNVDYPGNVAVESSIPSKSNIYKFVGVLDTDLFGSVLFGDFGLRVKDNATTGLTSISLFIIELVDDAGNMITSDSYSVASEIEVEILGDRRRSVPSLPKHRSQRMRRAPGEIPCGRFGDINNDGAFTVLDAQLGRVYLASGSGSRPAGLDVNQDGQDTIDDVIYLIRGLAFSIPFLCNVTTTPAALGDCTLKINLILENSDGSYPAPAFTFPHVMIQHNYITSAANDWDVSIVKFGGKSSPTPSGRTPRGGLWEAYPTVDNSYLVEVETALSAESIGLTVVLLTTNTQFVSLRSRFVPLYKPNSLYNYDQIPSFDITSVREPRVSQLDSFIGASGGYDPLITFDNRFRSDFCRYTGRNYSADEGKDVQLFVGEVGALTLGGSLANNYVLTSIDPPAGGYFTTALENGTEIIITDLELDAERNPVHRIEIEVSVTVHGPSNALSSLTAEFIITVTDANDNAPVFAIGTQEFFVEYENIRIGTMIYRFLATDDDKGANGEITYSINRGIGKQDFFIDPKNGTLYVARALDRERQFAYQLEILATDNGATEQLSADFNATVTVLDVNDNAPRIIKPQNIFPIDENGNTRLLISTDPFQITDNDNSDNGTISEYSIVEIQNDQDQTVSSYLFQFESQSQVSEYIYLLTIM